MQISPYLFLNGQAEEAVNFYASILNAQILGIQRYVDINPSIESQHANKVSHAIIRFGDQTMMFTDRLENRQNIEVSDIVLSLYVQDLQTMREIFKTFAESGKIMQDLHQTHWNAEFGHVIDRFGVHWMLNAPNHIES